MHIRKFHLKSCMNLTFCLTRFQNAVIFKLTHPFTETVIKPLTFTSAGLVLWIVCSCPPKFICQSLTPNVMVSGGGGVFGG